MKTLPTGAFYPWNFMESIRNSKAKQDILQVIDLKSHHSSDGSHAQVGLSAIGIFRP